MMGARKNQNSSGWTDERVETLKRLWTEGQSAAQIAKALTGISRSAILGKANRIGLCRTKAAILESNRANRWGAGREPPKPRVQRPAPKQWAANAGKPDAAPPRPLPLPRADDLTPTATINDLNSHTCRWPIGDPQTPGFGFCGRMKPIDGSYCPEHHKRAYGGLPRPRSEAEKIGDEKRRQSHKARIAARAA